jgi:RNA polymerase sigma factor (sigma-70 family)
MGHRADTAHLQGCLDAIRAGDPAARDSLLRCCQERLRLLMYKMLRHYPRVRRWEQSDDIFQNVLIRLDRLLENVEITTIRDFFRLASLHIRRELIDLARRYFGPKGVGANYLTPGDRTTDDAHTVNGSQAMGHPSDDPSLLEAWAELHQCVGNLPDEECEVFDLLWYQGLTQAEAAELLGIPERTVRRRWHSARVNLVEALHGELPR